MASVFQTLRAPVYFQSWCKIGSYRRPYRIAIENTKKTRHQRLQKPLTTLENAFRSPKYRHPTNVLYKIPCKDCNWSYIGQTGRSFTTRKKEHIKNVKNYTKGSNIANHAWTNDHIIDVENGKVIDKGNYRNRKP